MNTTQSNIGSYELIREVGRGGMGIVYEARHAQLHRRVALKVLPRALTFNRQFVERFVREGRLAAALNHPNVVTVYEAGEADGEYFLAMEFVEGTDLALLLRDKGVLEMDLALDILEQVAAGLDAAHEQGIVHRDIKPENILLNVAGEVKVGDFGIARAQEEASSTRTGSVVGTAEYMSPEQAFGKAIDHRSDIYSLACVAYEIFTGRAPFGSTSAERTAVSIIHDHAHTRPPDPRASNRALTKGAAYALTRALDKRPQNRYATATEFVSALRHGSAPLVDRRTALAAGGALAAAALGWSVASSGPLSRSGSAATPSASGGASEPSKPVTTKTWYLRRKHLWLISDHPKDEGKPFLANALDLDWNEERGLFLVQTRDGLFTLDPVTREQRLLIRSDWGADPPKIHHCRWITADKAVYEQANSVDGMADPDYGSTLRVISFDGSPEEAPGVSGMSGFNPSVSPNWRYLAYIRGSFPDPGFPLKLPDPPHGSLHVVDLQSGQENSERLPPLPAQEDETNYSLEAPEVRFPADDRLLIGLIANHIPYKRELYGEVRNYSLPDLKLEQCLKFDLPDAVAWMHIRPVRLWSAGAAVELKTFQAGRATEREQVAVYQVAPRSKKLARTGEPPTRTFSSRKLQLPETVITVLLPNGASGTDNPGSGE